MIDKNEAIRILMDFEKHYDTLEAKNYLNGNEKKSDEMMYMSVVCVGLRRRLNWHNNMTIDVFEMLKRYKAHFVMLKNTNMMLSSINPERYKKPLQHDQMMIRSIEKLEKRLRTIDKNKLKKTAS